MKRQKRLSWAESNLLPSILTVYADMADLSSILRQLIKQYRDSFTKRRVLPPVCDDVTGKIILYIPTEPWNESNFREYETMVARMRKPNTTVREKRKINSENVQEQLKKLKQKRMRMTTVSVEESIV